MAQKNIANASDYYLQNASLKVALAFFDELQKCYDTIELNPFFQIRVKTDRALP